MNHLKYKSTMIDSLNKLNSKLRLYHIVTIGISIVSFMLVVAYTTKYEINLHNVILERYAIIITLIGIPASLKLYHNKLKALKASKKNDTYLNAYKIQYIIRLSILTIICYFNIISLYITGSKNFYFMVIVTIFAFFLCAPQKLHIEDNEEDKDN